jgi:hypothetical protein
MRRRVRSLIVLGILAVGVVALVDALRGSPSTRSAFESPYLAPPPAPAAGSADDRLPVCTTRQLDPRIEVPGGSAAVALRHVSGSPCHLRRRPVKVWVRDREDHAVRLVAGHVGEALTGSPFRGDFTPAFEQLRNVTFLPDAHRRRLRAAPSSSLPAQARITLAGGFRATILAALAEGDRNGCGSAASGKTCPRNGAAYGSSQRLSSSPSAS